MTTEVTSNSVDNWGGKQQWWQLRWEVSLMVTNVASSGNEGGKQNWSEATDVQHTFQYYSQLEAGNELVAFSKLHN